MVELSPPIFRMFPFLYVSVWAIGKNWGQDKDAQMDKFEVMIKVGSLGAWGDLGGYNCKA